jgi:hypothetical protein
VKGASFAAIALCFVAAGFGHYPEPIRSASDIKHTPASEKMVVIVSLPLEDWTKLKKFSALEHFRIAKESAYQVTDEHLRALAALKFTMLRDVSLSSCNNVSDAGVEALSGIPSIQTLQLVDVGITDRGMESLATRFPVLNGINVERCAKVTMAGFLTLTNSRTINSVTLSLDPLSQSGIENIISSLPNVTWWTIYDPQHRLNWRSLVKLGMSRGLTIQVSDANHYVTGLTRRGEDVSNRPPPQNGANL